MDWILGFLCIKVIIHSCHGLNNNLHEGQTYVIMACSYVAIIKGLITTNQGEFGFYN